MACSLIAHGLGSDSPSLDPLRPEPREESARIVGSECPKLRVLLGIIVAKSRNETLMRLL